VKYISAELEANLGFLKFLQDASSLTYINYKASFFGFLSICEFQGHKGFQTKQSALHVPGCEAL